MRMFQGTITALITPFQGSDIHRLSIDYQTLEKIISWQLSSGINGFVVLGTTGEASTLEHEERIALIKFVRQIVAGKVPVIVGTGTNSTKKTIEYTKEARELGAEAVLVVAPYYNKPTQEGLYQHFQAVCREGGLPVVVYNIPGRSAVDISVETFRRLAQLKEIVAVKEASGSAEKLMALSETIADKVDLLSGEDSLSYLVMAAGGTGVISAASNAIPSEMVAISDAALKGKYQEALRAQVRALPAIRVLFSETNPAPVKAALKCLGRLSNDTLRLPLVSVGEETRKKIEALFR